MIGDGWGRPLPQRMARPDRRLGAFFGETRSAVSHVVSTQKTLTFFGSLAQPFTGDQVVAKLGTCKRPGLWD
jgi:hypothetical protein